MSGTYLSEWLRRRRLAKVAPFIHGEILDFGCGLGELLAVCRPATYVGYDLNRGALAAAREKYPQGVFCSDFAEIQGLGKKFDVIVMAAVIEHLEDPLATLRTLTAFMAQDGKLVLTTPHPRLRWLHEVAGSLGLLTGKAKEHHKAFLNRSDMVRLANDLGLQLSRAELFLFGANQLFVLNS